MDKSGFIAHAYCGLYCAACPQYIKTQSSSAITGTSCKGCKSDVVNKGWCATCNLKACAREKQIDFCYQCSDFPCENLDNFKNDPNYPYHGEIYNYLDSIKKNGTKFWLDEMKKRWACSSCSTTLSWWMLNCPHCNKPVKGYKNPG